MSHAHRLRRLERARGRPRPLPESLADMTDAEMGSVIRGMTDSELCAVIAAGTGFTSAEIEAMTDAQLQALMDGDNGQR